MGSVHAAERASFSQSLTEAQKLRLGVAGMTALQVAELDAAVQAFVRGEVGVAAAPAVEGAERRAADEIREAVMGAERLSADVVRPGPPAIAAPATRLAPQRKSPGAVADLKPAAEERRSADTDKSERFSATIVGSFHGWNGGTYFPLQNGQVWRQAGAERNEVPAVQNAEVEIFVSGNGYWRLRYNGAWITVKRLQ